MSLLANFPTEILQEVFVLCCTEEARDMPLCCNYSLMTDSSPNGDLVVPVQHTLRQTCRRWQIVVDGTSWLWSTIRITSIFSGQGSEIALMLSPRFVRMALDRSGTALIDIQIEYHAWYRVAPVLIPVQHRWRSLLLGLLHLQRRPSDMLRVEYPIAPETRQDIIFPWEIKTETGHSTIPTFENAQALQLIRCGVALLASAVPLPWGHLVYLSIDFSPRVLENMTEIEKAQIVQILSTAPALQQLGCTGFLPTTMPIITNPRITEFLCDGYDWLPFFNLPSLHRLVVIKGRRHIRNVADFLDQSQPDLQTLDLMFRSVDSSLLSCFPGLLERTPRLQRLRLSTVPNYGTHLEFSQVDVLHMLVGPGTLLVPLLEELCVKQPSIPPRDGLELLQMSLAALTKLVGKYHSLRRVALDLSVRSFRREWMGFRARRALDELESLRKIAASKGVALEVNIGTFCLESEAARKYRLL